LRGVSNDEPQPAAYPSRLAEDGEHLRMTVVTYTEPGKLCGQLSRRLSILPSVDLGGAAGLIMRFA
jgi:hypothetical protein